MSKIARFLRASGWKCLLLAVAAAAVPACADGNYRRGDDSAPTQPSSPHGQQSPSGPTP